MSGRVARRLRRMRAQAQAIEDMKTVYLANVLVPGQVFAGHVTWTEHGGTLSAECLSGSAPITAIGTDRHAVYLNVAERLVADMQTRGYTVVHVSADMIRRLPVTVEDARGP